LALLGARGEERVLADEELLYRPGEPYELVYVVLDGEILILDGKRDDARVIAELGRRKFLGAYGLLVGGMGLVTHGAGRSTRLLCPPIPMLLELVATSRRNPAVPNVAAWRALPRVGGTLVGP
jgi:CRP-like cAMP-binding protein